MRTASPRNADRLPRHSACGQPGRITGGRPYRLDLPPPCRPFGRGPHPQERAHLHVRVRLEVAAVRWTAGRLPYGRASLRLRQPGQAMLRGTGGTPSPTAGRRGHARRLGRLRHPWGSRLATVRAFTKGDNVLRHNPQGRARPPLHRACSVGEPPVAAVLTLVASPESVDAATGFLTARRQGRTHTGAAVIIGEMNTCMGEPTS